MDDLISRQAAIDAITDERIVNNMDSVYDSELHRCKRATHRILASLPSAQPARPRGKWIEDGYYKIPAVCSRCGSPGVIDFKYCPYCGARMGAEDADDETN